MNKPTVFTASILAIGVGLTGTAAAVGGVLTPEDGEAAPSLTTTLSARISPGLIYFHDSDGAVHAAPAHAKTAHEIAERCGFQPDVHVLEGAAPGPSGIEEFITVAACDAVAMSVTVQDDGSTDVVFLGEPADDLTTAAERLGLRLEVETDHAG